MQQDRSILDFVTGEVAALKRALGAGDRGKLTEYLDAVRDVERRIQTAEGQSARELPVVEQPVGIPDDVRRARAADVRPAGAGVSVRPDAGRRRS